MASYVASGSISPCRFVKLDTTQTAAGGGGYVLQAGTGDPTVGVSQPGVRNPPIAGLGSDDGYAAVAGMMLEVVTAGEHPQECWLEAGGAVTVGDWLKSDSSGRGVTGTRGTDVTGALALQTALAAGQLIRVRVQSNY